MLVHETVVSGTNPSSAMAVQSGTKLSPTLNALWIGGATLKEDGATRGFERLAEAVKLASNLWPEFYAPEGQTRLIYSTTNAPAPEIAESAHRCGLAVVPLDGPLDLAREQCVLAIADTPAAASGLAVLVLGPDPTHDWVAAGNGLDSFLPAAGVTRHPPNDGSASAIARAVFAPPRALGEVKKLRDFESEDPRPATRRFEYELLLRLIGEKPAGASGPDTSWEAALVVAKTTDPACATALAAVEGEFERADAQALAYGQRWRSTLAARSFMLLLASAMSGLVGTLFPRLVLITVPIQVFATLWMFIDRRFAIDHRWRQKWLEYRALAEHARIARFCLLARAPLPIAGTTWFDWRLQRVIHAAPPIGPLGNEAAKAVLDHLRSVEIADQIVYHRAAFRRFRHLDAQLKRAATVALVCTMALGGLFASLALTGTRASTIPLTSALSLCLSAAPALYAALGSLRTQLDVARQAQRSGEIAAGLRRLARELSDVSPSPALARAAALRAASVMSQDIERWERVMEIV